MAATGRAVMEESLLDQGTETLVLSIGTERRLQVDPSTIALLERLGAPYQTAEASKAVELYNKLAETTPAGRLFHSTC